MVHTKILIISLFIIILKQNFSKGEYE